MEFRYCNVLFLSFSLTISVHFKGFNVYSAVKCGTQKVSFYSKLKDFGSFFKKKKNTDTKLALRILLTLWVLSYVVH